MTAKAPQAAGLAIEVPSIAAYKAVCPLRSGMVEMIPTPGAVQASPRSKRAEIREIVVIFAVIFPFVRETRRGEREGRSPTRKANCRDSDAGFVGRGIIYWSPVIAGSANAKTPSLKRVLYRVLENVLVSCPRECPTSQCCQGSDLISHISGLLTARRSHLRYPPKSPLRPC